MEEALVEEQAPREVHAGGPMRMKTLKEIMVAREAILPHSLEAVLETCRQAELLGQDL